MTNSYVNWFEVNTNVVVLLAGKGTRFKNYSFLPKPMIPTGNGQTILQRTLASVPWFKEIPQPNIWFAVLDDDVIAFKIDAWLREQYGEHINVIVLPKHRGNLVAARMVVDQIVKRNGSLPMNHPLLILDGDNAYDGSTLVDTFYRTDEVGTYANVYYFKQENPDTHWCFVGLGQGNRVTFVSEKERITKEAQPMIGVFYFRTADLFYNAARSILKSGITVKNEFFMSQAIDYLVRNGDATPVFGYEMKDVIPLGTPQDVDKVDKKPVKQLRICLDIDDTINHCKKAGDEYGHESLQPGALETLRQWKLDGHYIILQTARHMKTCEGNMGKILARQGLNLLQWLKDNGVPYDEIWWAKPHADIFIDDKAIHHQVDHWAETAQQVENFLKEHP